MEWTYPSVPPALAWSPLVLIVHGRQGGLIPSELQALASDLAARRGVPVLLQALTAEPPQADGAFWEAARRAEGFTLVPLLLLPGGHVRLDLPQIAAHWRARAVQADAPPPRRLPFLGAWPQWQRHLAAALSPEEGQERVWLHHPLQGPLAQRYLDHLAAVLGCSGLATPYTAPLADLGPRLQGRAALLPLTLAANRLTESLGASLAGSGLSLHPPLLHLPAVREFLFSALEALP
jgi:sirohydrochlorin ferrochelatase